METRRSFVAIELPGLIRGALSGRQVALRQLLHAGGDPHDLQRAVKWVEPNSIHLTLKFLGEVRGDDLSAVKVALAASAEGQAELSLRLASVGCFPGWSRPRVIWVGIREDQAGSLQALQSDIDARLATLGFAREERDFSPHLTLARLRDTATNEQRQLIGQAAREVGVATPGAFEARELSLMRSQLLPSGPIYTRLGAWPFRPRDCA